MTTMEKVILAETTEWVTAAETMKKAILAEVTEKITAVEAMQKSIPVEAAVEAVVPIIHSPDVMWEKPAVPTIEELLTTEPSLIPLMTAANHWNLSAEQDR